MAPPSPPQAPLNNPKGFTVIPAGQAEANFRVDRHGNAYFAGAILVDGGIGASGLTPINLVNNAYISSVTTLSVSKRLIGFTSGNVVSIDADAAGVVFGGSLTLGTSQYINSTTSRLEQIGGVTTAYWSTSLITESVTGFGAIPFLEMVGTLADASTVRTTFGARFTFTGNGTGNKKNVGVKVDLREGYTGTSDAVGFEVSNETSNPNGSSIALSAVADNGSNLGSFVLGAWLVAKDAIAGGKSIGSWSETTNTNDPSTLNIGAVNTANGAAVNIGAYIALGGTSPRVFTFPGTSTSAALVVTNSDVASNIAIFYANATPVLTIDSAGLMTLDGYLVLKITDTNGSVEGSIWYDASEDKLKFKTAAGVETITSS